MYFDKNGQVVNRRRGFLDGGDSGQRTGMYYYGRHLLNDRTAGALSDFQTALASVEIQPGVYVRNLERAPRWNEWGTRDFARWNDPAVFSRDQQISLVIAMGAFGMKSRLKRLLKKQLSRFSLCQNWDLFGPHHWGAYVRSFNNRLLYPVLLVSDCFLLLGILIDKYKQLRGSKDISDVLNGTMILVQAVTIMPTPISSLCKKIVDKEQLKKSLETYFIDEPGDVPLHTQWIPVVEKYL